MDLDADTGEDHGLPATLCHAAAEVIVDKGLGSFSLREVARRAGVSHAAPGYHFGDLRGLLTALAVQGLGVLHRELEAAAAAEDDPLERLTAIGQAYVRVAERYPAHCEVVWREDVLHPDDPAYQQAGHAAFAVLREVVEAIAADGRPDLDVDEWARLCWSAMQGLVVLEPKLARMDGGDDGDGDAVPVEERVARFTRLLAVGLGEPDAASRGAGERP